MFCNHHFTYCTQHSPISSSSCSVLPLEPQSACYSPFFVFLSLSCRRKKPTVCVSEQGPRCPIIYLHLISTRANNIFSFCQLGVSHKNKKCQIALRVGSLMRAPPPLVEFIKKLFDPRPTALRAGAGGRTTGCQINCPDCGAPQCE